MRIFSLHLTPLPISTALLSLVIGCATDAQLETERELADAAEPDADASTDAQRFLECAVEADCASLGAGHMCMNGGCMKMDVQAPPVIEVEGGGRYREPALLTDTNPDPAIFEAELHAVTGLVEWKAGSPREAWVYFDPNSGYAGVPGPTVDVEVGTRVKIHFENHLPTDTTVHWHGLVLPAQMDGGGAHHSVVAPGESFDFEFTADFASTYWYHPHANTDEQVERGLYGMFIVRGDDSLEIAERRIVLDDVLLDESGEVRPPAEGSVHNADGSMTFEGMMGRQGNYLLVNGRGSPLLEFSSDGIERWRIINAANSRFFLLKIPGATFRVIGSDLGWIETPLETDELLITPGERYDVLVIANQPELITNLVTLHHDRGHDMADPGPLKLASIDASSVTSQPEIPDTTSAIPTLQPNASSQQFILGEKLLRGARVGFTINDELWPEVTPPEVSLGETRIWEIVNDTHMDHPFHLHGFRFQLVERSSELGIWDAERTRGWKDTIAVAAEETVRIVIPFEGFPGDWMFHCHILEHAERGMMSFVQVR